MMQKTRNGDSRATVLSANGGRKKRMTAMGNDKKEEGAMPTTHLGFCWAEAETCSQVEKKGGKGAIVHPSNDRYGIPQARQIFFDIYCNSTKKEMLKGV